MQLGKKIRDLRLRRGLTVQQLAQASHLSKGFISQVENERTSPSLSTLHDLAAALQTSVAYLVVEEDQTPHVVRCGERPRFSIGGNSTHVSVEVLSAQPKRNLELLVIELEPGAPSGDKRHFHHGEECVLVLEGRARLRYGEDELVLEAGDSCHYDGRVPHATECVGPARARLIVAMTPAAFEPLIRARATDGRSLDGRVHQETPLGR